MSKRRIPEVLPSPEVSCSVKCGRNKGGRCTSHRIHVSTGKDGLQVWCAGDQAKREDPNRAALELRERAMEMVNQERDSQEAKWGEQNHEIDRWPGILGEEYGEYCQAVNETVFDNGPEKRAKGGYDNMMKELSQLAAVAVQVMECLMRNKDRWQL